MFLPHVLYIIRKWNLRAQDNGQSLRIKNNWKSNRERMSIEHRKLIENKSHDQNKARINTDGGFVVFQLFCSGQKTFFWILYLFTLYIHAYIVKRRRYYFFSTVNGPKIHTHVYIHNIIDLDAGLRSPQNTPLHFITSLFRCFRTFLIKIPSCVYSKSFRCICKRYSDV